MTDGGVEGRGSREEWEWECGVTDRVGGSVRES